MKRIYFLFLSVSCSLLTSSLFGQMGPGGVGSSSSLELWMDASKLSLSNTDPVSSWTDFSGNDNHALQAAGANQPQFLTGQINGLPAIRFDGSNDYFDLTSPITSSEITIFTVVNPSNNTYKSILATNNHHISFGNSRIRAEYPSGTVTLNRSIGYNINSISTGSDAVNPTPLFLTNGSSTKTANRTGFFNLTNNSIGSLFDGSYRFFFQGEMTELIVFNQELNSAQRKIVSNYLAGKFNLTAEQNLYAFGSSHGNEIIGVGQESDGNHTSARGADSLQISNPSALGNGDFLLVGNDGGGYSTSTSVGPEASGRWTQTWQADLTGTPGTIDLTFYLGANDFAGDPNNYVVLIENVDGDFSNGGTSIQETGRIYDAINNTVTFTGISLNDRDYFTLAEKTGIAPVIELDAFGPGGVGNSTNLSAWVDASELGLSDSDPVSSWSDLSGNGNDVAQGSASNQPTFRTNQINGLPTIEFDGSNDYLSFNSSITSGQVTIFSVVNPSSTAYGSILAINNHHLSVGNNRIRAEFPSGTKQLTKTLNYSIFSMSTGPETVLATPVFLSNNNTTQTTNRTGFFSLTNNAIGSLFFSGNYSFFFQGQIAEVVVFNEVLNTAKRRIVSASLGAKYNLTPEQSLYAFGSTHGNHVIGIGQEADGDHTDARGRDSLLISNPSSLGNGDYLLVGNDGADFSTSTDVGALTTHRWNKVWRADVTGTPGTVDLVFYLGNNDFALDPNKYAVLVENVDGNFANGGTAIQETGRVYDATAKTVTFTGITLNDGDYFTLAEKKDIPIAIATGNWESTSTWSCSCIPTSITDVTIPSPFTVTINDLANAKSVTIGAGGSLVIGGNDTLQIVEGLTVNGTLNSGATGTILANGTSNQTFANSSGTNVELVNLVANNPINLFLTGGWSLNNTLRVITGTLDVSGADSLVLLSNASKTAEILESNGSFAGDFTLQRFIGARNANYSNIAASISNATVASIDDDVKISGVGGNFGNASASGGGIFYSMYQYDRSDNNSLDTIQSTATALTPGVGYELYLFTTLGSFSATTLDYVGTPNFGFVTPPSILPGFNLVGNPYHCHLEPANLDNSNISPTIYIFNSSTGSYSTLAGRIAPGQGFWVDNTSGITVPFNFDEGDKSASGSSAFVRQKKNKDFTLELSNNVNYFKNTVTMGFDYSATENLDQFDARFLPSPMDNASELYFTTITEDKLMKNTLSHLEESHVVPMEVKIGEAGSYTINSSNVSSILENYSCVYLKDQATEEIVDLSVDQNYTFEAVSGVSERFKLVVSNSFEACDKALNSESTVQKLDNNLKLRESYGNWFLDYNLGEEKETVVVSVYGMNGQQVLSKMELNLSENGTYKLDELNNLNGIFVIQIVGSKNVLNQTIKL